MRDQFHLPGLIGGILKGHRIASIGAVGIRKIGAPQAMEVTDQVHIGSCTKAMTATLIGMLVNEGKLSWGSTIGEAFPALAEYIHLDYQRATLSHLLTHRAGLPPNVPWWHLPGETPTTQRLAIAATMLQEPPRHRPGSTYAYSNVGYALAGLMAEKVADESWESQMRRRLFDPLEMASAGFGAAGTPGVRRATLGPSRVRGPGRAEPGGQCAALGPAGTVHCSMADWGRFVALHLAAARGQARLLKAGTFRALHTPPSGFEYAGGWLVGERTWASGSPIPTAAATTVVRGSGSPRPSTSPSSPPPTRATRSPRRPTTRRSSRWSGAEILWVRPSRADMRSVASFRC